MDKDLLHFLLKLQKFLRIDHRFEAVQRTLAVVVLDDLDLCLHIRVTKRRTDHKAVQLGIGKHLGSGGTNRVLGRDHDKGLRNLSRHAVHSHVTLLHYLQKSRLGLR